MSKDVYNSVVAKKLKEKSPKYSIVKWVSTLWHIPIMEYYTTVRMDVSATKQHILSLRNGMWNGGKKAKSKLQKDTSDTSLYL